MIERKERVEVYSRLGCPECMRVKKLLRDRLVPFTERSLDAHPQYDSEMRLRCGDGLPPQVIVNGSHVGGYQQLLQLMDNDLEWTSIYEECPLPTEEETWDDDPAPVDNIYQLLNEMRRANIIKDNRVGLVTTYKQSFKGEQFIDWIVIHKGIKRKEALEIGQELLDRRFGKQSSSEMGDTFSPDRYYQLTEDDENSPYNVGNTTQPSMDVGVFNEELVKIIRPLYAHILSPDQRSIVYPKLVHNDLFDKYCALVRQLQTINMREAKSDEKLAVLINVYNMMLIHITVRQGNPTSVWHRRRFFNTTYYHIDGHNYALQSIQNGILRGNKKGRDMLWKPFGQWDKRLPLVLDKCEPLVHFALTTGDKSSPRIREYTTQDVHNQLRENARLMLRSDDYMSIDNKKNVIHLSKIFKWYADDFGGTTERILEWIVQIVDGDPDNPKAKQLQTMFLTGEYKVDYLHYDSSFNGAC